MPRTVRDKNIGSRNARLALTPRRRPYYSVLARGLHLGYRRNRAGSGSWVARRYLGSGRYETEAIAHADDYRDANGLDFLTFGDAQRAAARWHDERLRTALPVSTRTPEGIEARRLVTGERAKELREIIESKAGLFDSETRGRFEADLLSWTIRAVWSRDRSLRDTNRRPNRSREDKPLTPSELRGVSQETTPTDQKNNLQAIEYDVANARAAMARLQHSLSRIDRDTYSLLSQRLTFPASHDEPETPIASDDDSAGAAFKEISRRSFLLRRWSDELASMHANLARLTHALKASIDSIEPPRGAPPRVMHREAICGLWVLWHDVTGDRPARSPTWDTPFYRFADTAIRLVWRGAPSLAGLIGQVCTEMRRQTP